MVRLFLLFLTVCSGFWAAGALAKETLEEEGRATIAPPDEFFYEILDFEHIVDGDTFKASGRTIRVWGINAPEKNRPLYSESSLALRAFLETGILRCKPIEKDKYRREVMHCYSGQNDLGALMVKAGFAKDFPKYSGGFYRTEEAFAREGHLGLWERTDPPLP
ncbi:MAG: thermonuclease family protein [Alphaproteobacteria bacterium]|nr:thermonuclease family protein [Alphaproteobacteria bacterium]